MHERYTTKNVALLAEGVDRNLNLEEFGEKRTVALLAEGVDRNGHAKQRRGDPSGSPSSRRAWIEI